MSRQWRKCCKAGKLCKTHEAEADALEAANKAKDFPVVVVAEVPQGGRARFFPSGGPTVIHELEADFRGDCRNRWRDS